MPNSANTCAQGLSSPLSRRFGTITVGWLEGIAKGCMGLQIQHGVRMVRGGTTPPQKELKTCKIMQATLHGQLFLTLRNSPMKTVNDLRILISKTCCLQPIGRLLSIFTPRNTGAGGEWPAANPPIMRVQPLQVYKPFDFLVFASLFLFN